MVGNGRGRTGLTVGLGYGILRVCEVSVEATRSHDAISFKLVKVCANYYTRSDHLPQGCLQKFPSAS